MSTAVVITTIQAPSAGIRAIATGVRASDAVIVIGDKKSPAEWVCDGVEYLSYDEQLTLPFASASVIPANSYTRKMLGYLVAATSGARWIRETDDDNAPYESFFDAVPASVRAREPQPVDGWVNIYSYFTDRFVWPRGYPLAKLQDAAKVGAPVAAEREVDGLFVLQAVADGDPDVDAVYRLTAPDTSDVTFTKDTPLVLPADAWTPFNSQATTWPRELLPLMYLPSTCSFRMTDIWRSFIAQRLMRGLGASLVITPATVFQDRNAHDLMRDFQDEIEGYVGYERLVNVLDATPLVGAHAALLDDLRTIYNALIAAGFLTNEELPVLDAWIADMRTLGFGE